MTHSGYAPALMEPATSLLSPAFVNQEAVRFRSTPRLEHPEASFSPLLALAPGPTQVIHSSGQSWQGVLLEKHRTAPGARPATCLDWPVLVLLCGRPARLEYRTGLGNWRSSLQHRDTVTVLPAGPVPEARLQTPAEFIYCAFEDCLLRRVAEEWECVPHHRPVFQVGLQDRAIAHLLYLLSEELEAEAPLGRLYVDFLAHALTRRYLLLGAAAPRAEVRASLLPPRLLNRVREKIETHLHTELSLTSLAEETGYSRAHFLRLFQAATGQPPHRYILERRLQRAQECLRKKNANLIDIAAECGFASQSHMTSLFRQHLGLTPAQFRRDPTQIPVSKRVG